MRVLLVDDDPNTLDLLDMAMELDGHQTLRAVNGEEAVATAAAELPDLIILDSMMPLMDGLTAARRIRETPELAETPIIMLTAKAMNSDVWAGWQAGVDSYITKPLDLKVLAAEMVRISTTTVPTPLAAPILTAVQ